MEVISCSHLRPAFFDLQNCRAALRAASPVALRFVRRKSPENRGVFLSFDAGVFLPARTAPVRTGKTRTPPPPPKKQKLPSNESLIAPAGPAARKQAAAGMRKNFRPMHPGAHPPRSFAPER